MNSDNTNTILDAERMLSHAYWYAEEGEARQLIYDLRNEIRVKIDRRLREMHKIALALNPVAPWL